MENVGSRTFFRKITGGPYTEDLENAVSGTEGKDVFYLLFGPEIKFS